MHEMRRLKDGRVLVLGDTTSGGIFLARYLANGTPDPKLGKNGRAEPHLGKGSVSRDLVLEWGTRNAIMPHDDQTEVEAISANGFCVKKKSGDVLGPLKDTSSTPTSPLALTQWEPSTVPWALHEAWLAWGRGVHDW